MDSLGVTVRYLEELEVESYTRIVVRNQDSRSAISVELTQKLTERVKDITLDFRQMLSVSDEVLEASHSKDTLACLAAAIVIRCTNLTRLSFKIGTDQI